MTISAEQAHSFRAFAGLSSEELDEFVAVAQAVTLSRDQSLFREGDSGTSAYLIVSGSVHVRFGAHEGQDRTNVTLERGAVLGELALLTDAARNATIVAETDVELWEIPREAFESGIGRRDRWAIEFLLASARELAGRFTSVNSALLRLMSEADEGAEPGRAELAELGRLRMRLLADWTF